jgi:hypothetical protein
MEKHEQPLTAIDADTAHDGWSTYGCDGSEREPVFHLGGFEQDSSVCKVADRERAQDDRRIDKAQQDEHEQRLQHQNLRLELFKKASDRISSQDLTVEPKKAEQTLATLPGLKEHAVHAISVRRGALAKSRQLSSRRKKAMNAAGA